MLLSLSFVCAPSALTSPTTPTLPPWSPLQVTDVIVGCGVGSSSYSARLLLSDKHHKLWSVVSHAAIHDLQTRFPEFAPTDTQLANLCGAILIPTQATLHLHPNMLEFIIHIKQFEVRRRQHNQYTN